MAFCGKCGKQIQDNMTICDECAANEKVNNQSTANNAANDAVDSAVNAVKGILDTDDKSSEFSKDEIEKNKVICALAYIPILFWLPLVAGTKDSKYCRFHANQGLILLILAVVLSIVSMVIGLIPIVGLIVGFIISIVQFGFFLFGLIYTLTGKSKVLPFIGGIKIL